MPDPDPRDDAMFASSALGAVVSLLSTASDVVDPHELGELLRLVHDKLDPAVSRISDYVPRAHPLAR